MRVIVLGGGRSGAQIAQTLSGDAEVILVEQDATAGEQAVEMVDAMLVTGSGLHPSTLRKAEVDQCDLFAACTRDDATNLASAALAKSLGCRAAIATVAGVDFHDHTHTSTTGVLGIDRVLNPARINARGLLAALARSMSDSASTAFDGDAVVAVLTLGDEHGAAIGKWANRLDRIGAMCPNAVVRGGALQSADACGELAPGDQLVFAGPPMDVLGSLLSVSPDPFPGIQALVVGGGDTGIELSRLLETRGREIRLLEKDRRRCHQLAERLQQTIVMHGDATRTELLRDIELERFDAVFSVTRSDEVNLMSALFASRAGAERCFASTHRAGYDAVYRQLGLHGTVRPEELIADSVRGLLPSRALSEMGTCSGNRYAVIQVSLPHVEQRMTIRELALPPGCAVLCDGHGARLSPADRLPDDRRLVLLADRGQLRELKSIFRALDKGGRGR